MRLQLRYETADICTFLITGKAHNSMTLIAMYLLYNRGGINKFYIGLPSQNISPHSKAQYSKLWILFAS